MTTTATLQQNAAASATATAATAAAAAARDSLKTAELHRRFTQDIRRQIEAEYNAAVDEETAACGDMQRKRRHADEMEESHKRVRSETFRRNAGSGYAASSWPRAARLACPFPSAALRPTLSSRKEKSPRMTTTFLSRPPALLRRPRAAFSE